MEYKFKENSNIYFGILLFTSMSLLSLLITSNSNSSPQGNNYTGIDSSVFKYIAKIMSQGGVPYLNGFDHKGVFLYFINYLAYSIHEHWGIWLLENIALILTMFYLYQYIKLYIDNSCISLIAVLFSMLSFSFVYNGGNFADEWEIPFIAISLYYLTKGVKNNLFKNYYALIIGICCSCAFLLRPNIVILWGVMALFILIFYILNKDFKNLFRLILWFTIGNLIILLPCLIYIISNNALKDIIYQCFIFNFNYVKNWPTEYNYYTIMIYFGKVIVFLLPALWIYILALIIKKNDKSLNILNLILYLVALYIVISPRNAYEHYAIILIPFFTYPIGISLDYVLQKLTSKKVFQCVLLILFIICFGWNEINYLLSNANAVKGYGLWLDDIKNAIVTNSNEDDNVLVLGNDSLLYLISNRMYHHKFFYSSITQIDDNLKNEFIKEINDDLHILIITANNSENDEINQILNDYYNYLNTFSSYNVYKLIES